MRFTIFLISIICFLLFFSGADLVLAFGVSPPLILNDHLVPGARFEQTVFLTQPDALQPLNIEIDIEASEIQDWLTIVPGTRFTIPAGKRQFPMQVMVQIPKDAAYETYQGDVVVKALTGGGGQITILTGAIVQLRLRVSGEEFSDFKLRKVKVPDIEEESPIKVVIELENLGNVKIRPSKVLLEIYDQYQSKLLETGEVINLGFIESFEKGEVEGEMPTKLRAGEYWAVIDIYKQGESILKEKRYFKIVEKGKLGKFFGLPLWAWILIIVLLIGGFLSVKFGLAGKMLRKLGINIKVERVKKGKKAKKGRRNKKGQKGKGIKKAKIVKKVQRARRKKVAARTKKGISIKRGGK